MHIRLWIILFGPVYAWWVYAFERMNGVLARFRTNGRGGGELEAILLRGWLKLMMLQDLVSYSSSSVPFYLTMLFSQGWPYASDTQSNRR